MPKKERTQGSGIEKLPRCPRRPGFYQRAFWGLPPHELACTLAVPPVYTYGNSHLGPDFEKFFPPMAAPIQCFSSDLVISECKYVVLRWEKDSLGSKLPVWARPRPPSRIGREKRRIPKVPTCFCIDPNSKFSPGYISSEAVTVFVHVYFDYHAWRREQEEGRQEDAVQLALSLVRSLNSELLLSTVLLQNSALQFCWLNWFDRRFGRRMKRRSSSDWPGLLRIRLVRSDTQVRCYASSSSYLSRREAGIGRIFGARR